MSEDRTPRTISLTSKEEGDEVANPRHARKRKHPDAEAHSSQQLLDEAREKGRERVEEMDPRDRARMTAR